MFTGIVSAVGTVAKASRETGNGKRETGLTLTIRAPFKGLKKGEIPVAVEFTKLPADQKVGFFRVARMGGKGSVSAAAKMKLVRTIVVSPEIVV